VLRQKLQQSRDTKNFQSSGVNGQNNGATAVLESGLLIELAERFDGQF
jgi:hypothetical protein